MNKRHNLKFLGLIILATASLTLTHSVDREKAAAATAQAEKTLEGNPQMTIPVTKAEKIEELMARKEGDKKDKKAKMKAEKRKIKEMQALNAAAKQDKKAKEAKKAEEMRELKAIEGKKNIPTENKALN